MEQIEVLDDRDDWQAYKTTCACFSNDHTLTAHIEYDKETNIVDLQFFLNVDVGDYYASDKNFLIRLWVKFKLAVKMLFTGSYQCEGVFLFRGEEQINDLADKLKEGAKRVKMGIEKKGFKK